MKTQSDGEKGRVRVTAELSLILCSAILFLLSLFSQTFTTMFNVSLKVQKSSIYYESTVNSHPCEGDFYCDA